MKQGDGDGTSSGMEHATREYVDLKLVAAMTEVRGEFAMLNQRLGDLEKRIPSVWAIFAATFAAVATGVAIILATLAFGGDRFDSGLGLAEQRQEQLERDRQQNDRIEAILKLLNAQSASPATSAAPAGATSGN